MIPLICTVEIGCIETEHDECGWFALGLKIQQGCHATKSGHQEDKLTQRQIFANIRWVTIELGRKIFKCKKKGQNV